MRRACRGARMSVRMTLAARIVEVLAENRVIARASSRGTAPGGSNVILTDTRAAHRHGLRPALAGCRGEKGVEGRRSTTIRRSREAHTRRRAPCSKGLMGRLMLRTDLGAEYDRSRRKEGNERAGVASGRGRARWCGAGRPRRDGRRDVSQCFLLPLSVIAFIAFVAVAVFWSRGLRSWRR